ncbi:MAG: sugar phosphorylase, partial [Anaerolineaceae bacterium]
MTGKRLLPFFTTLYGSESGSAAWRQFVMRLDRFPSRPLAPPPPLTARDAILITYPDQFRRQGMPPLQALSQFCEQRLKDVVTGIHILPFYPSTSDDGFAVVDDTQVDPAWGSWADIDRLGKHFRLIFDAVLNHMSSQARPFRRFCAGDPTYANWFIHPPPDTDLSRVVRPRTLPLLTPFETATGTQYIWTTFSADQVDRNFAEPQVLLAVLDALLEYVEHGAQFIRLDAIAYLWKEPGTDCIHRPQTHSVVQLIRAVLDEVAPWVQIITETNVPHVQNISYFGDGTNEAQMVYNFALPPLVLHTLQTGDSRALTEWASGLILPSSRVTFFNFLASHDGIGLNPAHGILSAPQIDALAKRALAHGGYISSKSDPGGGESPYELNINYFDALNDPAASEPLSLQVDRFAAAHAVQLALLGQPAIYVHSLLGSRGWRQGVEISGQKRAVNRQKFDFDALQTELADPTSQRAVIFSRLRCLLSARSACPAFHPFGRQIVLNTGSAAFTLLRIAPDERSLALCMQNITADRIALSLDFAALDLPIRGWRDCFTLAPVPLEAIHPFNLMPYQTL